MQRKSSKQPVRGGGVRQRRDSTDWRGPSAFSYSSQRAERTDAPGRQKSSLVDKRHRMLSLRFWVRRSGLLIAIIAALVCLVSIVSLSNDPRIVLLDEVGTEVAFHESDEYRRAVAKELASSVWNKNKITVDVQSVVQELKRAYPELSHVSASLPLVGHRPIFYLQANQPAFIFQTVNGTYVLDSTGRTMIAKDAAPQGLTKDLPIITDQTGVRAEVGKQSISSSEASFIRTVIDTLRGKQMTVASLTLPSNAVQQLDVKVEGQPYLIKFNMHDPTTSRQQVGTYLATANTLAGQKATPTQYIDVRVLGRAYYQ